MTDIRHLQLVLVEMIKDIDALCTKNNIEYYLLGGSAIGAIRHQGFIPWDDDLDIIMTADNYDKFLSVCQHQLNQGKYTLQEGEKDWPLPFSKIRLNGTKLEEIGVCDGAHMQGIYLDVFRLDNAYSFKLLQLWQYFCGKVYLCYTLSQRSYQTTSWKKKLFLALSVPLRLLWIRNFFKWQATRLNNKPTTYLCFLYGRTKFRTSFTPQWVYGKPLRVPYEGIQLPVPRHYDIYLTQMFGDYMKLPPETERVGLHVKSVDFGKY